MTTADRASADVGLIGLAVMGENLALNMADHGYRVAVYNRTTAVMEKFVAGNRDTPGGLVGAAALPDFVAALKKPLPISAAPRQPPPGPARLLRRPHLRTRGRAAWEILPRGLARPEAPAAARLTAVHGVRLTPRGGCGGHDALTRTGGSGPRGPCEPSARDHPEYCLEHLATTAKIPAGHAADLAAFVRTLREHGDCQTRSGGVCDAERHETKQLLAWGPPTDLVAQGLTC